MATVKDAGATWLKAQDLGQGEQRVALRGELEIAAGVRARASLWQTSKGLYLVAARNGHEGIAIDLLARDDLRYEHAVLADRLQVGSIQLGVPRGRRREVERAIALGRLRGRAGARAAEVRLGRHIRAPDPLASAFLASFLQPNEQLLAWLPTESQVDVDSTVLRGARGAAHLYLSQTRAARVALSSLGDARVDALDGEKMVFDPGVGSAGVLAGRFAWTVARSELELYREIAGLLDASPARRLREIARLNWLGRADPAALQLARRLLDQGTRDGDPLATCAAFMTSADLSEPNPLGPELDTAVLELASHRLTSEALAELWHDWQLTPEAAMMLLDQLRRHGEAAEPWALALHERLHARLRELRRDRKRLARADIELAEHLIATGRRERARGLLEKLLDQLPSEELEDLLPSEDADLTAGAGGQLLRIRTWELVAEARQNQPGPDVAALSELARLQPLVRRRVAALAAVARDSLRARAEDVLAVLAPGGLAAGGTESRADPVPAPLPRELIDGLLVHPAAREGGALVGKLQALLAVVPVPDHRMLLEYVEPLSASRHAEAERSLARAARALGLADAQGFVSRGKKGIGLRGYDGPPPFVLVGGRHLDADPDYGMSPTELSFAIGTEVAHLAWGHCRVTSSEVWAGTLEKSKQGLEFLLGVLPLFKGWKVAERAYRLLQGVPTEALGQLFRGAARVRGSLERRRKDAPKSAQDDVLSALNEDLVAAHRLMQLSADRAGLVLVGDLRAALRAMLLIRPDHRAELGTAERDGIEAVLAQRDADGHLTHQDLSVRIAALVAFYLSDEYVRLRSALVGP